MSKSSEDKPLNLRQQSSKISSSGGVPSLFQIRPEPTQVKQLLSVLVSSVSRKSQKEQDLNPDRYKVPQSNQCFSDAVVKLGGQTNKKELRISETTYSSQKTPNKRDKSDDQSSSALSALGSTISKMRPTIESPITNNNQKKQHPGKNYFLRPAEFCQGKRSLALNELSRSIQNSSNSHRTLSSFQTKRSDEELQQRKSTQESVMIKNKYNKLLSHSVLFQPKTITQLKLPETSRNMFEMNIIQEIDNKNYNSENNIHSQSQSVIKDVISPPKKLIQQEDYSQSPKKTLSSTASQKRLQSQLIELSKGVLENKNHIENLLNQRDNIKNMQSASLLRPLTNDVSILPRSNSAVKMLDNKFDMDNPVLVLEEQQHQQQQSPSKIRIKTSPQNKTNLDKNTLNLLNLKPQKLDEDIQYFQEEEQQCYYSNQLSDFKEQSNFNSVDVHEKEKMNSIDYCLFEIMEQLETEVIGQLQEQGQKFNQDCFITIQKILTQHIPSVLLRLRQNDKSQQDTNLQSFVSYISNFLSWFLSAADNYFMKCVAEKVKIEEDKLEQQIKSLENDIQLKQQIIEDQMQEITAIQLEMIEIKSNFQEEKSKLNFEINSLEEKIEEMANADAMQDTSHKLSLKIIDLQTLMNNLQRESQNSGKHLEDHLCSLGFSVITKTKQDLAYFEEIKKDFNMARISDEMLHQILNDHPFFTAFTYNKIINHKNNLENEQQIDLSEEEMESLLKEYFKTLKEEEIDNTPCAETFMEFILSKNYTQSQSFREIEEILRFIMKDCSNPLNLFFQRLFGIGGFVIPTQEAVKEIIVLSRELNKLQSRTIEEQVSYTDEVDKLVSRIVSNQNAVIDFRNKFISSNKISLKSSPYIILGHLLSSISSQEDLEKVEDICNSMAVSQNDSLDCFEQKLAYKKVKQIAQQLHVRPFTFFNYLLQTYEKYSRDRKKPVSNSSQSISFDSRPIPKVLQDCYVNFSRYQQMQYAEETQTIVNRARASSNKQYNQNLSQESDDYIVQTRISPATSFSRNNNIGKRKIINFKAQQPPKKDKSDAQNSILDFSGSSKQSKKS